MNRFRSALILLSAFFASLQFAMPSSAQVTYPIVYIRSAHLAKFQEVMFPMSFSGWHELVYRLPDGTERVLDCKRPASADQPVEACVDVSVSLNGENIYYSKYTDVRDSARNYQRWWVPVKGADLWRMNLATGEKVQLTFQEFTPNTGVANWAKDPLNSANEANKTRLGYGILNLGATEVSYSNGHAMIMFTSSRDAMLANKEFTAPNLRLYIGHDYGTGGLKNVEEIGFLNIGSAMHPFQLKDGRVIFSSYETHGLRDNRVWALWSIWPDGREFEPNVSAFRSGVSNHFQGQDSAGRILVTQYYNLNNWGFGTVMRLAAKQVAGLPAFGSPDVNDPSNPSFRIGLWNFDPTHQSHLKPRYERDPFSPPGYENLTAFVHREDRPSDKDASGEHMGKVTHPAGAPNGDVMLTWTGRRKGTMRFATDGEPFAGIYIVPGGVPIDTPNLLVKVVDDPAYNEQQARPVVPYSGIYGVAAPHEFSWLPNDGAKRGELPKGTPYGIVGTSSMLNRNVSNPIKMGTFPKGVDPFNPLLNIEGNWFIQGAESGAYTDDDIYAVRVVAQSGVSHRSYGPNDGDPLRFKATIGNERLHILGEFPVRKGAGIVDGDGKPDTSFLAKIPANVSFTFQTLNRDGLVLNNSQTWHQVRPGEVRNNCGGCHAHANQPTDFAKTAAAKPDYNVVDLTKSLMLLSKDGSGNPTTRTAAESERGIEFYKDIKPLLERSCVGCHNAGNAQGNLRLDMELEKGIPKAYNCLANDSGAACGHKPVIQLGGSYVWRAPNQSRYVRALQSRRSLLVWKVFGRRLDGMTNATAPTESVPGDASTLPAGTDPTYADLDYTGTIMPPPGSGFPPLTEDEKMMIGRWVDLGTPISYQNALIDRDGWFSDEVRPTLYLLPAKEINREQLREIRIGMTDFGTGLDMASFSVKASFEVNGSPPQTELASKFSVVGDGIWALQLNSPLTELRDAELKVSIKDKKGNIQFINRVFSVLSGDRPDTPQRPAIISVSVADKQARIGWAKPGKKIDGTNYPADAAFKFKLLVGERTGVYDREFDGGSDLSLLLSNLDITKSYYAAVQAREDTSTSAWSAVSQEIGFRLDGAPPTTNPNPNEPGGSTPNNNLRIRDFDFDGDGTVDRISKGKLGKFTITLSSTGEKVKVVLPPNFEFAALGDYNGDSKTDIGVVSRDARGLVWDVLLAGEKKTVRAKTPGVRSSPLINCDLNGDRTVELAWFQGTKVTFRTLADKTKTNRRIALLKNPQAKVLGCGESNGSLGDEIYIELPPVKGLRTIVAVAADGSEVARFTTKAKGLIEVRDMNGDRMSEVVVAKGKKILPKS